MCRGLALGIDENFNLVCEGKSSHTDSNIDNGKYLKLELLMNTRTERGYVLEVDENTNERWDMFQRKDGKLKKPVQDYIYNEIRKNESYYLRMLLFNMTFAKGNYQNANCWKAGEYQFANVWEAGDDQDANGWKAGKNQYATGWEAGKNQYATGWEAGNDQDARHWEAGNDQNANVWKAGKNQYATGWEAGKNQNANYWEAGNDQVARHWEAGNIQDFSYCKAKKRIVSYQETDNEENNSFINMLSDNAENNELDWDYVVELARNSYYKI